MIKIYNELTKETTYVNSIYEIPLGWRKYKNYSAKAKKNMSDAAKKRGAPKAAFRNKSGENNPMFGHKQSDESKQKISETKKLKKEQNPNYGVCGKHAYYDKDTLKIKYFSDTDIIPDNFIKGRPKNGLKDN